MSTNRSRRIDRDAAEQLLGGKAVGAHGDQGALSRLLGAAAAPATEAELVGEEAAVAAFREAALLAPTRATVPAQRSRPLAECLPTRARPRTAGRFLGARAAVAALTVTALGGVAVAAGTGHLPAMLGGSPNLSSQNTAAGDPSGSAAGKGHLDASTTPHGTGATSGHPQTGSSATSGKPAGGTPSDDPSAQLSAPAAAALLALCKAWPQDDQQGNSDSRFEPLTRAAGGSNRVREYCAVLAQHGPDGNGQDGGGQGGGATAQASRPADDGGAGQPGRPGDPGDAGQGHGKGGAPAPATPTDHPSQDPNGVDHTHTQPAGGHGKP